MKKLTGFIVIVAATLFLCLSCNAAKKDPFKAMIGDYPADYGIAYSEIAGYSKAPTIRSLFGPEAPYASTFSGSPSTVILESGSGSRNEFNVTILISRKDQNIGEEKELFRYQFKFQPDNMTEKSYVRYVKIANLQTGQVAEQQSPGGEYQDGRLFGMFMELMRYIWDVEKLKQH